MQKTLFDYLRENRDKDFSELPFNEVDSTVLAELCYVPLEKVFQEGKTLRELAIAYFRLIDYGDYLKEPSWFQKSLFLLLSLFDSKRYRSLIVEDLEDVQSEEDEIQFTAMLFRASDFFLVGYRGTDSSLLGWKEDFNLLCRKFEGVRLAQEFLKKAIARHPQTPYYVLGHSKGGFLAEASLLGQCEDDLERMIRAYSLDGPGLPPELAPKKDFALSKFYHVVPSDSFIGAMFSHRDDKVVQVVDGTDFFLAHDAYTWVIDQDAFVSSERSALSKYFESSLSQLLDNLDLKQRKIITDLFFDALEEAGYQNANEIFTDINESMKKISSALLGQLRKSKTLFPLIRKIFTSFQKNYFRYLADSRAEKKRKKNPRRREDS